MEKQRIQPSKHYETLLASMPYGLDQAVIKILKHHFGESNGVFKKDLMFQLKTVGFSVDERQFRLAIYNLRHQGFLIGSSSTAGYFMVSDLAEFERFAEKELQDKINNMTETLNVMRENAHTLYGTSYQVGLV